MIGFLNRNLTAINFHLALILGYRSLKRHRVVAFATILGVALGMLVVATILIVDFNTAHSETERQQIDRRSDLNRDNPGKTSIDITRITVIKKTDYAENSNKIPVLPNQQLDPDIDLSKPAIKAGEDDYQTMRLAIRLASLLAFFIGAVIVFYTMRFSVTSRSREFCLLRCIGEYRSNIAVSLVLEAFFLGTAGVLVGIFIAFPTARTMLQAGISTTGRLPLSGYIVPVGELSILALAGVGIALLGVIGPLSNLYKMNIAEELQPRFSSNTIDQRNLSLKGFEWMFPPLIVVGYLAIRPFLVSWLSVVYLFVFEACLAIILSGAILWWTTPVLRIVIRISEFLIGSLLPLETILTGRRMRLTTRKVAFSVTSIILVFSLLSGLHSVIRALKHEINLWSEVALVPYEYFRAPRTAEFPDAEFLHSLQDAGIYFFRMSAKTTGTLPFRLIYAQDINQYLRDKGIRPLEPGKVIFSKTLAARFGIEAGDHIRIDSRDQPYRFEILDVRDDIGFFLERGQYIDQKSFALFSEGNPLFADSVELTLGQFAMAKTAEPGAQFLSRHQWNLISSRYIYTDSGRYAAKLRIREIDKDFLIFDFVLIMTVLLAVIGVVNALLIQVQTRSREFAVLMSLGMSRMQIVRLLLVEGFIIGLVGAFLATALGALLGFISVSFLNQFTLFDYSFVWSFQDAAIISVSAIACCCLAASYPAFIATRTSSAESLHYE